MNETTEFGYRNPRRSTYNDTFITYDDRFYKRPVYGKKKSNLGLNTGPSLSRVL